MWENQRERKEKTAQALSSQGPDFSQARERDRQTECQDHRFFHTEKKKMEDINADGEKEGGGEKEAY